MSEQQPMALREKVDPTSTALLVIDVQNDYANPDGWLGRRGADIGTAVAMLPRLIELIGVAREAGVKVVYTRNWHRSETDAAAWVDKLLRTGQSVTDRPGIADTWGAELFRVAPAPGEEIVSKFRYDGFLGTNLEYLLHVAGIRTVVCTGTTTNVCVESTARSAHHRDFHVVVVEDCCAAPDVGEHEAALNNIRRYFGQVVRMDELLPHWVRATP